MIVRGLLMAVALIFGAADMTHALEVTAGGTGFRNSRGDQKWQTYRDVVEKTSGGKITMKLLVYGELGGEENLVAGIRRGRVQVSNWSGAVASTIVPELALLYAPYLFNDYAEADFVMDNYLFPAYSKLFAAKDIYFMNWDEIGFGQVWSKTPIIVPEDAKGRRFRVASSDAAQLFAQALNADVIPMAFTDIVSSLQTGLIEAGETGAVMYVRTGILNDARHITMTDHNFATSVIVMKKSWVEGLPAEERKVMTASWIPMVTSRQWTRDEVAGDLTQAKERGFTVHTITPKQRALWRQATSNVTKQLIDKIGGDAQRIWDIAQEGKKAYAAQKSK